MNADIARRVVARILRADSQGEEDSSKGGVPPRWKEWLDAVHQGGQERVPNPNPETRDRYKDVSYSTALKDKNLFRKAMKEYHEWLGKNPEKKDTPADKPAPKEESKKPEVKKEAPKPEAKKEESKGKATPGIKPKGALVVSPKDVDATLAKHKKAFEEVVGKMKDGVAKYEKKRKVERGFKEIKDAFAGLSETEKMIHVNGHMIGEVFAKSLTGRLKETHDAFIDAWSSNSGRGADRIQGLMSSLGVEGYMVPGEEEAAKAGRDKGPKDKELAEYVHEVMKFNAAIFKHLGLKEVTLFRGVHGQGAEKAKPGDTLEVKTREMSSFSTDPKVLTRVLAAEEHESMEHATPEALEKYLKEHPGANKSNHKVKGAPSEGGSSEPKPKRFDHPEFKEKSSPYYVNPANKWLKKMGDPASWNYSDAMHLREKLKRQPLLQGSPAEKERGEAIRQITNWGMLVHDRNKPEVDKDTGMG